MPKTYTVPPAPPHNEGQTVAAWTLVAFVVAGCIGVGLGMALANSMVIIIGVALIALGLVAGFILSKAGFGQTPRKASRS